MELDSYSVHMCATGPESPRQSDLLVEDHVHSMGFNVSGVLPHELQDIFNSGSVGQATKAHTVPSTAGRWKEGRCGENRDGHDRWGGQCGDQGCGHVTVQDLVNAEKRLEIYTHRITVWICIVPTTQPSELLDVLTVL